MLWCCLPVLYQLILPGGRWGTVRRKLYRSNISRRSMSVAIKSVFHKLFPVNKKRVEFKALKLLTIAIHRFNC